MEEKYKVLGNIINNYNNEHKTTTYCDYSSDGWYGENTIKK